MVLQYNKLKEKNIEVVGLSLDSDAKSYSDKVKCCLGLMIQNSKVGTAVM